MTAFEEVCPYCNTKEKTTCDELEDIKDKCLCADFYHCDIYIHMQAEINDSEQCAIDAWKDSIGYDYGYDN